MTALQNYNRAISKFSFVLTRNKIMKNYILIVLLKNQGTTMILLKTYSVEPVLNYTIYCVSKNVLDD